MTVLFIKILNMSLAATWMVMAVAVLKWIMKKAPKWIHCALWAMVAFRLLCPFSFESVLSLIPSKEPLPQTIITGPSFDVNTGVSAIDRPVNAYLGDRYYEGVTVPANNGSDVVSVLTVVWVLGMAAMAVYAFVTYRKLSRKVAPSIRVAENVYLCDYIDTPFILGVIKPKIYLPSTMDSEAAEYVLAHEKAHILRRDHWWKPFGFTLLAIHWFNPAIWFAYVLLCRDIELACDEKVIRDMDIGDIKAYSEALLNCSMPRHMIAACPLAFGEVGVKERVKSVLNYKKPAFWIILTALIACVIVAICFLTDPVTEDDPVGTDASFQAGVLRVADNSILVSREGNSTDLIWVTAETEGIRVGDTVEIEYDGMIAESYPAQIHNVYEITVVTNLLTDDVLAEIRNTLGAGDITFFDYQTVGDYGAVGCKYDGKYSIVYLRGSSVHKIVPQEDLLPMNAEATVWRNRSMMQVTGIQLFLITDPNIAGVYSPGDEDSWIYVYNYPALIAADEDYQLGLDGSLAGGYIPAGLQDVVCGGIHLKLPTTWEYETYAVAEEVPDGETGRDDFDYGIWIWPAGETEGRLDIRHTASWGVCGTGLLIVDAVMKPNGYPAAFGYYDGSDMWSYIQFGVTPGTYVVLNDGAESWWDEYEDEAMSILGNMTLGSGTANEEEAHQENAGMVLEKSIITEADVLEIASQLRYHFETIEVEFNQETDLWDVYYYDKDHNQTAYVTIDPYGNVN